MKGIIPLLDKISDDGIVKGESLSTGSDSMILTPMMDLGMGCDRTVLVHCWRQELRRCLRIYATNLTTQSCHLILRIN